MGPDGEAFCSQMRILWLRLLVEEVLKKIEAMKMAVLFSRTAMRC
jgi:hypothetical protein